MAEGESGGGLRAGGAYVELLLKDEKYNAGLEGAQAKLDSFADSVKVVASAVDGVPIANLNADLAQTMKAADAAAKGLKELHAEAAKAAKLKPIDVKVTQTATAPGKGSVPAAAPPRGAAPLGAPAGTSGGMAKGFDDIESAAGRAAGRIASVGSAVTLTSGVIGGVFAASVGTFNDLGNEIADGAARLGVSVEAYQSLGFAAKFSATDVETLEAGLKTMQKGLADAAGGSEGANKELHALGLTVDDLAGKSPDEQFRIIADRIAKIPDPGMRAAAAMNIFGKAGQKLVPLLSQGRAGIEALETKAHSLGVVMSQEAVSKSEAFADELDTMYTVVKYAAAELGSSLVPSVTELAKGVTQAAAAASTWVKENNELVATAAMVTAGVFAAGTALLVVAGVIGTIGFAVGTIGAVLGAVLSPLGLLVAGVTAGAYAFFTMTEAGRESFASLSEFFGSLAGEAQEAWGGVVAAIQAGDMQLAADILGAAFAVAWGTVKSKGIEAWNAVAGYISAKAASFMSTLSALLNPEFVWAAFQMAADKAFQFITDQVNAFASNWQRIMAVAGDQMKAFSLGARSLASDFQVGLTYLVMGEEAAVDVKTEHQEQFRREVQDAQKENALGKRLGEINAAQSAAEERSKEEAAKTDDKFGDAARKAIADAAEKNRLLLDEFNKQLQMNPVDPGLEEQKKKVEELIAKAKELADAKNKAAAESLDGLGPTAGGGDPVSAMERKYSSSGTFNGAALRALGGVDAAERTANAAEATAKNTKKIAEKVGDGEPVWAD